MLRDFRWVVVAAVVMGFVTGCSPTGESVNSPSGGPGLPAAPSPQTMLNWAEELAARELAHLAAAEMLYRNDTYEYILDTGDFNLQRVCAKSFREFRDFEIVDIETTASVLKPVKYTIRYNYDLFETVPPPQSVPEQERAEQARTDFRFRKEKSDGLVRVYESGQDYRPQASFSPILERPNYWESRTSRLFGHTWSQRKV